MNDTTNLTVLLAEDSLLVRETLASWIASLNGLSVVGQAGDVAEAIEQFRRLRPDLAILDISMPGGTGLDVLRVIKQERPETTVLMFTNYAYPQYRRACEELGADFFYQKAGGLEALSEQLQRLATGGAPVPVHCAQNGGPGL